MNLLRTQRRLRKGFNQMREIAVRMAGWGDAFIDLKEADARPGKAFTSEGPQHFPGRRAAAYGEQKAAARWTAARAAAATNRAAARATAGASGKASICIAAS